MPRPSRTRPSLEALDPRVIPSAAFEVPHAVAGLKVAVERFAPTDRCLTAQPVFALDFSPTGVEGLPARNGLDVAVSRFQPVDPCLTASPVFFGLGGGSVDTPPVQADPAGVTEWGTAVRSVGP